MRGAQAVEVGARLASELDEVLEAGGGDERRPGALALQQRVGGHRRAVRERADLVGGGAGALQRRLDGGEHALRLVVRRRRRLGGDQAAARGHHRVGERPAHVDPQQHVAANLPGRRHRASARAQAASTISSVSARCWCDGQ
jgi:hypothetical protein